MPGARCTRSLAWKRIEPHERRHREVHRNHPAFPHAMVLTAYFVISPVIGLCCHRHLADWQRVRARLGRHASAKFDASVEASGPHDLTVRACAVRRSRPRDRSRETRPAIPLRASAAAAIASCPAFVTIAIRPSGGQDGAAYRSDLGKTRNEKSLEMGLDRESGDLLLDWQIGHTRPNVKDASEAPRCPPKMRNRSGA
jgi:hypothetical protein